MPEMRVEGVEVHVKETEYCARRSWAAISTQSASLPYLLGSSMRKTLSSTSFPPPWPSSSSNGEPKRLLESNVMVANGRPLKDMSSSASVVRKRLSGAGSDFLEMNNIGKLGSLQDVIEDELGACDGPWLEGLDIPRREG
jgi:hypothetical protein